MESGATVSADKCTGDLFTVDGSVGDSLDLPGGQLKLLEAVSRASKKTIVVLVHGRPATFGPANELLDGVDALFAAWRPGEEAGTAIINLLTGKANPSAKLAQSWPRTVGHVLSGSSPWLQAVRGKWIANSRGAQDSDGRRYDNYVSSEYAPNPLFDFGYGLSYTEFKYGHLNVTALVPLDALLEMRDQDSKPVVRVSVEVTNTGTRVGTEIVQVYVKDPSPLPFVPFWKRLAGFGRISLEPAATSRLTVEVQWQDLAMHDNQMPMHLRVFPGTYEFSAGGSSVDTPASACLEINS